MSVLRFLVYAGTLLTAALPVPSMRTPLPALFVATVVVENPDKKEDYTVFSYVAIGETKADVEPEVSKFISTNYGSFKLRSLRIEPVPEALLDKFCAARQAAKRKAAL